MWRQYASSATTYQTARLRNAEGYPDDTVLEQHLDHLAPSKPTTTVACFSPWRPCLIPEQLMWDLWWTRLFCSGHFTHTSALASQLSFNQCSIFVFNTFRTDKIYLFLTVYNPTFLWPKGELERFIYYYVVLLLHYGSLLYFISILVKVPWRWSQQRPKHSGNK